MSKDTAAIRDQLGIDPDIIQIPNFNYNQTIQMVELSAVISGSGIGHSTICGSSTNGIVGVNTNTEDGLQQVVGGAGRGQAVQRVVNPNNTFREFFRDTDFKDTDEVATADWNITLFRIAMTTSTDKQIAYNTVVTSKSIFFNAQTVFKVTVTAKETKFGNDLIKYYVRADNDSDWEEVTKGIEYTFKKPGVDLRFKVILIGNGANDTYLEELNISYTAS